MSLTVLSVVSELYPLIKTGGLADVAGALPGALAREGVQVRSLLPSYPKVRDAIEAAGGGEAVARYDNLFGGPATVVAAQVAGLDVLAIDAPHLYGRPGDPYTAPDGREWPDNALRFAALGRVAADLATSGAAIPTPDVVHVHDWQAGLTLAYLAYDGGPRPKTVATIHNMAFQGWFPASTLTALGLPLSAMAIDGVEYFGGVGYLKAALNFADRITTVSPTYATEILEPDGGLGLDGLLAARASVVSGILNGIDTAVWDPAKDPILPSRFSAGDLSGRARNRAALEARFGLGGGGERLLFGVISRLSSQKGLDLLAEAADLLVGLDADLALIGAGEPWLEDRFRAIAERHPGRIGCFIGYDEALAHLMQAGADAILVPSRFEPCGLTQLCALRYGAIPVVARVGGLADTVIDANPMALAAGVATGVQFAPSGEAGLSAGLRRTAALFADREAWGQLQANAMATDVSWARSAKRYVALYEGLLAERR